MKKLFAFFAVLWVLLFQVYPEDSFEWNDHLERNFENLPVEKQIEIYCTYFSDSYGTHSKMGYLTAIRTLEEQQTVDAIPYLKYHFAKSKLEYDSTSSNWWTLKDVTIPNILNLIGNKVRIMKNLDKSVSLWFLDQAESKILEYISNYRRIDKNIQMIEVFIQYIRRSEPPTYVVAQEELPFVQNDPAFWGKLLHEKYISSNGFELLDIGLTEELVFPGYEGRVIYED